ncbi:MAG TPA: ATP-binding protein, partial [Puia sp.]|nr:ATP-binding protein [Puia sp.]
MGEVLRAVGAQDRIEQRGVEDGSWIEADVPMMERVVQNLLVNALAYTPEGGRIGLSLARVGNELVFSIENDGPALPEELLAWLNGQDAVRPSRPAVGLTIVRKVLLLHGYVFHAESVAGRNRMEVRMGIYGATAGALR